MPKRIDPELRARAVRLVAEHRAEYPTETAAVVAVAKQLSVSRESVRRWMAQVRVTNHPCGALITGSDRLPPAPPADIRWHGRESRFCEYPNLLPDIIVRWRLNPGRSQCASAGLSGADRASVAVRSGRLHHANVQDPGQYCPPAVEADPTKKNVVSGVVNGSVVKMSPSRGSQYGGGEHDAVDVQRPYAWNSSGWCTF